MFLLLLCVFKIRSKIIVETSDGGFGGTVE